MKPIICACGTEKVIFAGYIASCPHCELPCGVFGCSLCKTYSIATNKRVAVEHARERSGNG